MTTKTEKPRGLLGFFEVLEKEEPAWRLALKEWLARFEDSAILNNLDKPGDARLTKAAAALGRLLDIPLQQVRGPKLRSFAVAGKNSDISLLLTAYLGETPWALRAKLLSKADYPVETESLVYLARKPTLLGPSGCQSILEGLCIEGDDGAKLAFTLLTLEEQLQKETAARMKAEVALAQARQRLDLIQEVLTTDLADSRRPGVLPPHLKGMKIEELDLATRTYIILKKRMINTLDELILLTGEELFCVRNFGRKSLSELRGKVAGMGLTAAFSKGQQNNWPGE